MCFLGHPSRDESRADPALHAPQDLDLAASEWQEVEPTPAPADDQLGVCTILSFWAIAAMLLLVIVAAPALEAAAHRLH
ncbi:MAG: hypothetical protein JO128_24875 [Alphaproteobacteria bacterium]|nr:hypothetical protein [Alphaproteobacteria bacterium]